MIDEVKRLFEKKRDPAPYKHGAFPLNRVISYCGEAFFSAEAMNRYLGFPMQVGCRLLELLVPARQKAPFIKFIPFGRAKKKEYPPELIDHVCRNLCCNIRHGIETIKLLEHCGVDVYAHFGMERKKKK